MIGILILLMLIPSVFGEGPSFEVASIRPAPPLDPRKIIDTRCHGGPGTENPIRWTCSNVLLGNLVANIFDLKGFQLESLSSVPEERFTIAAKIPDGTTKEQFRQMKLNLVIERFGLKFHHEKKEIQGYELIIAKGGPKLKESKPESLNAPDAGPDASNTLQQMKVGKDGSLQFPPGKTGVVFMGGPNGQTSAHGQWIGITMEEFATRLVGSGLAGFKPVIDATGLKGKYDLTLDWAPDEGNARPILSPAQSGIPIASEPSGGPTIFTALQKQLGLKLQSKKVLIEMLVIDHIEKAPTED